MIGQSSANRGPRRPKILHVIGSLGVGGAERGLVNLVARVDPALAEMKIVALIPGGALTEPLRQRGISIETLSMRPGFPDPLSVLRLARRLRQDRPDVVVTWMYHANLIGGLAARLAGEIPVVWNIRHTLLDPGRSKRLTRWVARAGGLLSRRIPERIVFVAHAARAHHATLGYGRDTSLVIPNGFDLDTFRPDLAARDDLRRELGLAHSTALVGLIGRFHPDKDHRTFLAAAGQIHQKRPDARFVLCGTGVSASNPRLAAWADEFGVRQAVHFLGCRDDVPRIAAGLDLAVCSSRTEAFPQAIGEAMACALPCVVTDVGDAALLVGATGRVVPPGDAVSLGQACLELLALGEPQRVALGQAARRRIAEHFALDHVLSRHLTVWHEACASRKALTPARDHERLQAA